MSRVFALLVVFMNCVLLVDGKCGKDCQCVCPVKTTTASPEHQNTRNENTRNNGTKPYHNVRLPSYFEPLHYQVFLSVDMESKKVIGNVTINLQITNATEYIFIHAFGFTSVAGMLRTETGEDVPVRAQFSHIPNQYHVMELKNPVQPGIYQLAYTFLYTLKTSLAGFYQFTYRLKSGKERSGAFTQFQPTDARSAFPCFDEPALRATFDITIQHPTNYNAISNMPIIASKINGSTTIDTFSTTPSMPTYLLAFAVVQFGKITVTAQTKNPVQMTFYAPEEEIGMVKYAIKVAKKVLPFFERYYNVSYPLPKADMIAVPEFASGAMENWGLVGYRMRALLHDEDMSSLSSRSSVAAYISHELAHMWFGNLVTMHWWSDLWLNEGFASYVEYLGIDAVFPQWKYVDFLIAQDMQWAMKLDALVTSHPIYIKVNHPDEINEIFDSISYHKGASVIRMLDNFLGTKTFNKGITSYLKKHSFGIARTGDLWKELTKVSQEAGDNYNVSYIMNTWILQMGFPLIKVMKIAPGTFKLTQERFLSDPNPDLSKAEFKSPYGYKWVVPFNYMVIDPNQSSSLQFPVKKVWMNMTDAVVYTGSDNLVIKGNAGQYGYFRVTYDQQGWDNIIKQLKINHKVFDIKDRVGLITDAFALASSGRLKYTTALNLLDYIHEETDYLPWKAARKALGYLKGRLSLRKESNELIKAFMKSKTSKLYKKFEFKKESGFLNRKLQVLIVNTACSSGNEACMETATNLFNQWKDGYLIPSDFQWLVLFFGVYNGGEEEWNFVFKQYMREKVPSLKITLLISLCATKEPRLVEKLMRYSQNSSIIRSQDIYYIFRYVSKYSKHGRYHAWYFVKENWPTIVKKYAAQWSTIKRVVSDIVSGFGSMEEYEMVKEFFDEERLKGAGQVTRSLKQALEKIKFNHQWSTTHAEGVTKWLKLNVKT